MIVLALIGATALYCSTSGCCRPSSPPTSPTARATARRRARERAPARRPRRRSIWLLWPAEAGLALEDAGPRRARGGRKRPRPRARAAATRRRPAEAGPGHPRAAPPPGGRRVRHARARTASSPRRAPRRRRRGRIVRRTSIRHRRRRRSSRSAATNSLSPRVDSSGGSSGISLSRHGRYARDVSQDGLPEGQRQRRAQRLVDLGMAPVEAELAGAAGDDVLALGDHLRHLAVEQRTAKAGHGRDRGRWMAWPSAFESSRLVTGRGAVALIGPRPSAGPRARARTCPTTSSGWIHGMYWRPPATGPPTPSLEERAASS